MKIIPMLAVVTIGAGAMTGGPSAGATSAQVHEHTLVIALTGAAEGPGLGDPDGSGRAELRIDAHAGRFCYVLTVADIAPARLAHIHKSPVGEAGGPIVVSLEAPTDGSSEGCTPISPELAQALLQTPADYYVNVHNQDYPGGAVRGQLG
jgi:hypothetical protein